MNNKSMTESELKEFFTALKDSCGNKEKEQWYMGLIEDLEIAFTEDLNEVRGNDILIPYNDFIFSIRCAIGEIERYKDYSSKASDEKEKNKYLVMQYAWEENLSFLKNVICKNKKPPEQNKELSDEALEIKFRFAISGKCFSNIAAERAAEDCVKIAKQYSDSKLSELEKWIDENKFIEHGSRFILFGQLKIKIQSLK